MTACRRAALLALPAVLVAACSSSGGGIIVPGGTPTDAAGLGRLLQSAVAKITSAHIALGISFAGQNVTGSGDETLANGKLTGLDLTESLPGGSGSIQVIVVDGKTYAKLPASLNTGSKPWLLVTQSSSNPVVQQLAASLDSALSSASLGSVSTFTKAAKSVQTVGTQTVAGVPTTHYKIVVDVAKLPADLPGRSALESSGLKTLPIDLNIDSQGRPVQFTEQLTVQGQSVATKATITDYDKPVTITAPPASQVGG